jgi:hypothetical protein
MGVEESVAWTMNWQLSHRADKAALPLADRHYSRQKIGSPQFVPPGRCIVLLTPNHDALWVTHWPFAHLQFHGHGDMWICSLFRNESDILSSELITEALAVTAWAFGEGAPEGTLTYVDATKVRHKRDPGRCFLKAGFVRHHTNSKKDGLVPLLLPPELHPSPAEPIHGGAGDTKKWGKLAWARDSSTADQLTAVTSLRGRSAP